MLTSVPAWWSRFWAEPAHRHFRPTPVKRGSRAHAFRAEAAASLNEKSHKLHGLVMPIVADVIAQREQCNEGVLASVDSRQEDANDALAR